jgi:hypothetical protein
MLIIEQIVRIVRKNETINRFFIFHHIVFVKKLSPMTNAKLKTIRVIDVFHASALV